MKAYKPEANCGGVSTDAVASEAAEPGAGHHRRPAAAQAELLADRTTLVAYFRAAFAAHQLNVAEFSDDEIGQAICAQEGPTLGLSDRQRLGLAFKRLRALR